MLGYFLDLFKKDKGELKFSIGVVESLDSSVKFSRNLERNGIRDTYKGEFKVAGYKFSYKYQINTKERTAYFSFKIYIARSSFYGTLNILTPMETLSVFSTIKEILLEHIDEFDQLEYDAADEKLLKFYIALASSHFVNFKHTQHGLKGTLVRNGTEKVKTNFKKILKGIE